MRKLVAENAKNNCDLFNQTTSHAVTIRSYNIQTTNLCHAIVLK